MNLKNYNGVTDGNFVEYCKVNGIETICLKDRGMYGAVMQYFIYDNKVFQCPAYQSTGYCSNFTCELSLATEITWADVPCGKYTDEQDYRRQCLYTAIDAVERAVAILKRQQGRIENFDVDGEYARDNEPLPVYNRLVRDVVHFSQQVQDLLPSVTFPQATNRRARNS